MQGATDHASSPLSALSLLALAFCLASLAARYQALAPIYQADKEAEPALSQAARSLRDGGRLDVNRASQSELELLPGIGPALSERVVEGRPFDDLDDLLQVRGIGPRTLERLRPHLQIGPPSSSHSVTAR